jgi:outer membrane protein assembly factor BamB
VLGVSLLAAIPNPVLAVGWRSDTTGSYTNAAPPLQWSTTQNIAWSTPMPGPSTATPLLAGDRIWVLADPNWLLCLDQQSGRILWQASNDVSTLTLPETYAKFKALTEERHRLWQEASDLKKKRDELAAGQKDAPSDEKAASLAVIEKQIKELDAKREKLPKAEGIKANEGVGQTCCTPVSDGTRVFALFNNGVGACYDRQGKRLWSRFFHPPSKGYGQSMSPALADDTIGVHVDDEFYGIALADGQQRWMEGETQHQGSPVSLKVGNTWVFLTTDGNVREAKTGKLIQRLDFPALNLFTTPAVFGTTAYWIAENKFLVRATFVPDGDSVKVRKAHANIPKGLFYASVLVHDGLAYLCNNVDYKLDKMRLYVVESESGKVLLDEPLGVKGWAYPSPTLAGKHVFIFSDKGECRVLQPTWEQVESAPGETRKEFKLVEQGRNTLEASRSCPVFEGRRLYIRGLKNLYAIESPSKP